MSESAPLEDARQIHFVTGRFAESLVRQVVDRLSRERGFEYTIQVLPITVAALMTPDWVARHLDLPPGTDCLVLPGYCRGESSSLRESVSVPVVWGPKDIRQLPEWFGGQRIVPDLSRWSIEIIAEINHVPRLTTQEVLQQAQQLVAEGADRIDLGCDPDGPWSGIGDLVRAVRDLGIAVSIDSLDVREIEPAVAAGAELVLSVNSNNCQAARDWGCEVVVIPDSLDVWESVESTIECLIGAGVPFRLDPILEPIGRGLAASFDRYFQARRRWPDLPMLMGTGNLSELTDVDSAGVNMILLGFCQELGIESVLTTQVINWARSAVRECDWARRLVYWSVEHKVPPKNLSDSLVMLRDPRCVEYDPAQLQVLADQIRDSNCRVFVSGGQLHLLVAGQHLYSDDPFELFEQWSELNLRNQDVSHAFYLGFELCKAMTARQLGKQYEQDEPLRWGMLTQGDRARHRPARRRKRDPDQT